MLKIRIALLAIAILSSGIASAVCSDPKTWESPYRVPLREEIKSSIAIVIGNVIEEKQLLDEPSSAL